MQRGDQGGLDRLNDRPMRKLGVTGARCSRASRGRRWRRCRTPTGNSRNGVACAPISTITSRSTASTTRSRMRSSALRSTCRLTARTIELFHRGQRIAAHQCRWGGHNTALSRSHAERAPALRRMDARSLPPLGPKDRTGTDGLIETVLANRLHPNRDFAPVSAFCGSPRHRSRARRNGLRPRHRDRRAHLQKLGIHPRP